MKKNGRKLKLYKAQRQYANEVQAWIKNLGKNEHEREWSYSPLFKDRFTKCYRLKYRIGLFDKESAKIVLNQFKDVRFKLVPDTWGRDRSFPCFYVPFSEV